MEFGNIHTDQRDGVSGPGINHHIRADIGGVIGQQINDALAVLFELAGTPPPYTRNT